MKWKSTYYLGFLWKTPHLKFGRLHLRRPRFSGSKEGFVVTWQNPKLIFYVLENLISFLLEMRCLIGQWYQLFLSKLASRGTSLIKICVATRRLQSVRLLAIEKEPLNLLSRNDKPRRYFIFVKKKLSNIHRISYLQDHSAVTRYCVTLFKNTHITEGSPREGHCGLLFIYYLLFLFVFYFWWTWNTENNTFVRMVCHAN